MERGVLVVGESVVDVVHTLSGNLHEYAGGSAANVAVALARLGRPTRLATSFARDHHGEMIAAHLERAGVALACDPAAVDHTSTAQATLGTAGAASYTFDIDWRLLPVPDDEDPLVAHTCSLGAVLLPGADDVLALLTRLRDRATVTYDVNARPAVTGTGPDVVARVERMVAVADLVKASDEDLETLYPGRPHVDSVAALLALGPAAVVVTRGADGAGWTARGRWGPTARSGRDTIGAGDTFGAALVDAPWTRGGSAAGPPRCTPRAPRSRRARARRPGPRPSPSRGRAPTRPTATSWIALEPRYDTGLR